LGGLVSCKCPFGFRTNHETFLARVGPATLRSMREIESVCELESSGRVVEDLPLCDACDPLPDSDSGNGPWVGWVVEDCPCDLPCVNGTCNAETQRCDCFEGFIGAFCNIPSSSFSTTSSGFSPPNQRFSNNSTLSNIFVLVVLTLLVFIVVVSIMLCKHRGSPGTAAALAAARRRAYVPRNVPIFAVDISRSAWEQEQGKTGQAADDVPFPIVIDTDDGEPISYFVLRLPLDDVPELSPEELLDSGRAILAFRMASILDTSSPFDGDDPSDPLHPELAPSPLSPPLPSPPTPNRPQPLDSRV